MELKISPIKDKPLRQAGQSTQERIDKIIDDDLMEFAYFTTALSALMAYEWARYFFSSPPHPLLSTVIFLIALGITVFKFKQNKKLLKALKQGRDGEKVVGEFLERLREDGCVIFHDIVGNNFNIDHVIISDKGIFLIETKTYSIPKRGAPKVRLENGSLWIDGLGLKNEILSKAKASAAWLNRTILEGTEKSFFVKPVVVFPGWVVEANNDDIWIIEPKQLPDIIRKQSNKISDSDKRMVTYYLSRFIRSH